jgi:leucyl aminopeptidase
VIEVTTRIGRLEEAPEDTLMVGLLEGVTRPGGAAAALDRALDGAISRAIADGLVTGKRDRATVLPTYGRLKAARVVVAGLGPKERLTLAEVRRAVAVAGRIARRAGARRLAMVVHGAGEGGLPYRGAVEATVIGLRQGLWRYDGYRTRDLEPQLEAAVVVEAEASRQADLEDAARRAATIADALSTAREVGILGSNDKYPERMAERARAYAAQHNLEVQVLDEKDLAEMGAGAILGVGQGSVHPPRMVTLRLPGARRDGPTLALVGKGITFDSGGISLKPAEHMEEMKYDLSGAAAVMTALGALSRLGSPLPVIGIMCLAENLPSGSAQRPGDVVRTLDGQTIEVQNTDAEGRLVLADGLALARRLGATHLVDAATLTGAVVVALGHAYSGLMASDEGLARAVEQAAAQACEKVWRLPIDDPSYDEAIRSTVADMRNVGGRPAGALTAAALLRRFTGGLPWAHLDIAGTAWSSDWRPDLSEGPTGAIVETFIRLPEALASA